MSHFFKTVNCLQKNVRGSTRVFPKILNFNVFPRLEIFIFSVFAFDVSYFGKVQYPE